MVKLGIKAGDYAGLESYYISRLTDIVSNIGSKYIVWQEPLDNGVKVGVIPTFLGLSSQGVSNFECSNVLFV